MRDVFLIPSEKNRRGGEVLGVYGRLSGLVSIDAVILTRPLCMFRECTEKRGVHMMGIFPAVQGRKLSIEEGKYALLAEDMQSYEIFTVVRQEAPVTVVLKEALTRDYRADCRIYRPVYGRASPEGDFILRGRDDSDDLPFLIRYRTGEDTWFRKVDMHREKGEIDLTEGAVAAVKPETTVQDRKEEQTDE